MNLTGNQKVVLAVANGFLVAGGLLLHSVTKVAVGAEASADCSRHTATICSLAAHAAVRKLLSEEQHLDGEAIVWVGPEAVLRCREMPT